MAVKGLLKFINEKNFNLKLNNWFTIKHCQLSNEPQ